MQSELWQRLRAARHHADLRQEDIAKVCSVSRGAVAQWESAKPENRNNPSVAQLSLLADATGVPVTWLMDNTADPGDLVRLGRTPAAPAPLRPALVPVPSEPAAMPIARQLEAFRLATAYEVLLQQPTAAAYFDPEATALPLPAQVGYCSGHTVAQFVQQPTAETLGAMLVMERAAGAPLRKLFLIWLPGAQELPAAAQAFLQQHFADIEIHRAATPQDAAAVLLSRP